ncbi:hypothetical protein G9A89_006540 [Geosiphon pyriformis]|nr:hypothetical protein G9A89_006540 [Geosiphon pyriformis]
MANVKVEGTLTIEILKIKNNPPKPVKIIFIPNSDAFLDTEIGPEEFHKHYQNLAPTREEQEQCLEQLNTQLYDYYFNSNPEQYIVLSDFTKEQKLKQFSNNNKSIMPEYIHDIDAEFNLRYPEKEAIKLEPYLHTCINLKVALEIPATTIVQLAFRSSLAKKGINIREKIIDAEYVRNIIAMLQNNSEKIYIIKPNKKITQAIFLLLVKITQLVSIGNWKKFGITAKKISGFEFMDKIDILVNMAEEKTVNKGEIISIH